MENRVERVILETEHNRIVGSLTMPREGYRSRLSDYLNHGDTEFIPLADAVISSLSGGESYERGFIAVNRHHIRIAYPLNEVPGAPETI